MFLVADALVGLAHVPGRMRVGTIERWGGARSLLEPPQPISIRERRPTGPWRRRASWLRIPRTTDLTNAAPGATTTCTLRGDRRQWGQGRSHCGLYGARPRGHRAWCRL